MPALVDRGEIYVYRSKSYQGDRMAMTPMLRQEIMRWLVEYERELAEQRPALELCSDMYLFPRRTDRQQQYVRVDGHYRFAGMRGDLVPCRELNKPFRVAQRALQAFGIKREKGQGMHMFRRSAARAFFESLVDRGGYDSALRATMTLLGHASSKTTESYLGVSFDRRRRNELLTAQDFLPVTGGQVIALRAGSINE